MTHFKHKDIEKLKTLKQKKVYPANINSNRAAAAAAAAKSLQSCPTLCDPTDGSPPGSPVPGMVTLSITM